uniref:Kelch-like protein 20 n=1 Tax=Phallusia mammillata TaxID=59560 RepID=A0A6F9DG24_9ASCI|nr:kelch-like protein 20 [Phallusia mammillata]
MFGTMSEYFHNLFSKISVGDQTIVMECAEQFGKFKKFVETIYNGELKSDGGLNFTEMYGQEIGDNVDRHSVEKYIREKLNSDRLGIHKYCDITISTGLRKFPVHKSILAVHSKYFATMFSTNMKEKRTLTCEVTTISDDVMALVLDLIYTKQMWVENDQFLDLVATSDYLLMKEFQAEVLKWGVELVTCENCIQMWITGHQCQADLLIKRAGDEICKNLSSTQHFEKFLVDQMHFEELFNLIMGRISDDQVLRYALTWVKQDIDKRKEMFERCFDRIKLESLSHLGWTYLLNEQQLIVNNPTAANAAISYMKNFVRSTKTDFTLGTMYVLCSENSSYFKVYECDMSSLKPQSFDEEKVFVPKWSCFAKGHFSIQKPALTVFNATLNIVDQGTLKSYAGGGWRKILDKNEDGSFLGFGGLEGFGDFSNPVVACYDDIIYVAGGNFKPRQLKKYEKGDVSNKWKSLATMPNKRESFALVPYKGLLFAIGGQTNWAAHSVDVCSIRDNLWSTTPTKCPVISNIKMTIVHDDIVYIVYGLNETHVATFDLAQRKWIPGKSAETALVERCASLTLGIPDFRACVMDFNNTVNKGDKPVFGDFARSTMLSTSSETPSYSFSFPKVSFGTQFKNNA